MHDCVSLSHILPLQVSAIDTCFREPVGRLQCSQIQGDMDEGKSSGPLGKAFFGT